MRPVRTLRGTTAATVVLTYLKGVLSYKVVLIDRDWRSEVNSLECGGKRSATPLWILLRSSEERNPKRRRAALAAALQRVDLRPAIGRYCQKLSGIQKESYSRVS